MVTWVANWQGIYNYFNIYIIYEYYLLYLKGIIKYVENPQDTDPSPCLMKMICGEKRNSPDLLWPILQGILYKVFLSRYLIGPFYTDCNSSNCNSRIVTWWRGRLKLPTAYEKSMQSELHSVVHTLHTFLKAVGSCKLPLHPVTTWQ